MKSFIYPKFTKPIIMKLFTKITTLLVLTFSVLFFACKKEEKQADTQNATISKEDSLAAVKKTILEKRFLEYLPDFQTLVLSFEGDMRNVAIGDSASVLVSKEGGTQVSKSDTLIQYQITLNKEESANIDYLIKDGKVNGMNLWVKMKTEDQMTAMVTEFTDYFTQKYGNVGFNSKGQEVWKATDIHEVDIIEESVKGKLVLDVLIK